MTWKTWLKNVNPSHDVFPVCFSGVVFYDYFFIDPGPVTRCPEDQNPPVVYWSIQPKSFNEASDEPGWGKPMLARLLSGLFGICIFFLLFDCFLGACSLSVFRVCFVPWYLLSNLAGPKATKLANCLEDNVILWFSWLWTSCPLKSSVVTGRTSPCFYVLQYIRQPVEKPQIRSTKEDKIEQHQFIARGLCTVIRVGSNKEF